MATATRTPLSQIPTAPLPPEAVAAMRRLEAEFPEALAEQYRIERTVAGLRGGETAVINGTPVTAISLPVAEALTRYEIASERKAELEAKPTREWSGAEFDSWAGCDSILVESLTVLLKTNSVGLVRVSGDSEYVAAARYKTSEARANDLIAIGRAGRMSDLDADDLAHHVDLMAAARAVLVKAGRLKLIGGK